MLRPLRVDDIGVLMQFFLFPSSSPSSMHCACVLQYSTSDVFVDYSNQMKDIGIVLILHFIILH